MSDISDFQKLFNDFYIPLCLFAERYLENKEEAADIAQDAFIKLWQKRSDFDGLPQIKSFLYTTVRNRSLNELEHRLVVEKYSQQLQFKQQESFFHDHVIEEETYRILTQAIDKLPSQTRKVMLLALSGKDNKEIAQDLAISEGTVHSHKKIAYRRLRDILKDYFYLVLPFI